MGCSPAQRPWRRLAALATAAALLAACSGGASGSDDARADGPTERGTTTTAPPCRADGLPAEGEVLITGTDPVAVAAGVAERTHRCSAVVVVAPSDDAWAAAIAAAVALDEDAPLLLIDPADPGRARPGLARLEPSHVVAVGVDAGSVAPPGTEITALAPPPPARTADAPATTAPVDPTSGAEPAPGSDGDTDTAPGPGTEPGAGSGGASGSVPASPPPADPTPGGSATSAPPAGVGPTADPATVALSAIEHLGADRVVAVPADDADALAAATVGLDAGAALLPLPADPEALAALAQRLPAATAVSVVATDGALAAAATASLGAAGLDAAVAPGPLWPDGPASTAWLVDPAQGPMAAVAATAAGGRDEPMFPVTAPDLRSDRQRTMRVRSAELDRAVLVGDVTADATWQLPLITSGRTLPGGGFKLFEGERMVALYGHPGHGSLGVLGEQDLDATVERARQVAAPYGTEGLRAVPTFEIIATVASAEAGDLGDYSRRTSVEVLRPYVERAAAEGFYVVLDLQSGRTDFLTQARHYEELLLEPHVGLALDPEWRLLPDQVHLRQVGSVAAAEVQQVADWLAELTRTNQLPEKLLVLHQFRHSMLPDRDTIADPPELAMVVHMDGQGPISSKNGTYAAITAGAEDRWLWGWKNFYDEDVPTPTPQHVLGLDPVPVFVSYQ